MCALRLVHPLKGHRWGTGQKRCPARTRRANAPPNAPSGGGGGGWGVEGVAAHKRMLQLGRRDQKKPHPTESDTAPAASYRVSDAPSADPTERHLFTAQPTSVGPRAARRLSGHAC